MILGGKLWFLEITQGIGKKLNPSEARNSISLHKIAQKSLLAPYERALVGLIRQGFSIASKSDCNLIKKALSLLCEIGKVHGQSRNGCSKTDLMTNDKILWYE